MNPRPATQDDVAAMVELQRAGFVAALVPLLPSSFDVTATDAGRSSVGDAGERERWAFVVDARTARPGGAGDLRLQPRSRAAAGAGEIRALFVHPDHWRRGVGRGLVEEACAQLERWATRR